MSTANLPDKDCHKGVCEVTFRPGRAARKTFENLKAMAGELIDKVKETLSSDSHNAVTGSDTGESDEKAHLAKLRGITVRESNLDTTTIDQSSFEPQVSMRNAAILERLVEQNWSQVPGHEAQTTRIDALKMVHVKPRPDAGQIKPGRFDNPWRYDSHH